jgi:hypothetical protein
MSTKVLNQPEEGRERKKPFVIIIVRLGDANELVKYQKSFFGGGGGRMGNWEGTFCKKDNAIQYILQ